MEVNMGFENQLHLQSGHAVRNVGPQPSGLNAAGADESGLAGFLSLLSALGEPGGQALTTDPLASVDSPPSGLPGSVPDEPADLQSLVAQCLGQSGWIAAVPAVNPSPIPTGEALGQASPDAAVSLLSGTQAGGTPATRLRSPFARGGVEEPLKPQPITEAPLPTAATPALLLTGGSANGSSLASGSDSSPALRPRQAHGGSGVAALASRASSGEEPLQKVWQANPAAAVPLAMASQPLPEAGAALLRMSEEEPRPGRRNTRTVVDGPLQPGFGAVMEGPAAAARSAATVSAFAQDVAKQCQVWISSDVRNAELQLDGVGDQPVQVQISLSGNEAQVVFRTDQAQARDLLGGAMSTLDQMLRGQGLALAGAWVGGSGTQGQHSGSKAPPYPSGTRMPGTIHAVTAEKAEPLGISVGPSQASVDCFV
jgi:flagellar hook-length control protein FliK